MNTLTRADWLQQATKELLDEKDYHPTKAAVEAAIAALTELGKHGNPLDTDISFGPNNEIAIHCALKDNCVLYLEFYDKAFVFTLQGHVGKKSGSSLACLAKALAF